MGIFRTKEDDVAKISTSIYVSNFPEVFSAKDLFHACKKYGHVIDSFIPFKKSKDGKRFGFVRFINVFNMERLGLKKTRIAMVRSTLSDADDVDKVPETDLTDPLEQNENPSEILLSSTTILNKIKIIDANIPVI
ncbi:nucleotide-binding alpha-beta plait domain-containing protein [Tanacetum coccineum]